MQELRSPSIGKEPEVANAHEATRQQMEEKPAEKLIDREVHDALAVAVGRVSLSEDDVVICERNQPTVGNSYAVRICAKVAEDVLRTAEWRLGIDHPIFSKQ